MKNKLIPFQNLNIPDDVRQPLKIEKDELERLTITIQGQKFISFGNALICPTCGVQQGILNNCAPDGEVNFYVHFRCTDYKETEDEKKSDTTEPVNTDTTEAPALESGEVVEPEVTQQPQV